MGFPGRRLTIFGNYAPDANNSMNLYAELLFAAGETAGFDTVRHARPHVLFGHAAGRVPGARALAANLDKFVIAPLLLNRADILHIADHANAVYLSTARAKLAIVTCHDLIPFLCLEGELSGWRPSQTGRVLLDHIAKGLRLAQHVVCVSQSTRADLVRLIGIPADKISVIPNCLRNDLPRLSHEAAEKEMDTLGIPSQAPFVLNFGSSFYKNRYGAFEMFVRARARMPKGTNFVSLGPPDGLLLEMARAHGCAGNLIVLSRLSSCQMAALYGCASALLFPSLYEGFGFPIIEAQSFGLPVIASKAGPISDVAGDAAILIDPQDCEAGAEALTAVIGDELLRARLIEKGRSNVTRFSFENWRDAHRALYARLLAA